MAEIENSEHLQKTDIAEAEKNELQKGGAEYANEFFISVLENNSLFRFSFCERNIDTKELNHRASIIVSRASFNNITNMLLSLTQAISAQEQQMMQMMNSVKMQRNTAPVEEVLDVIPGEEN